MARIVVDPELGLVSRADFLDRRPELEVVQPAVGSVPAALDTDCPVSLVTGIKTWTDRWLPHLSPGDWVATVGVGYDPYPVAAFQERDVTLTNCPGVSAPQVAEHAFAMACSFTRRLWRFRANQRRQTWAGDDDLPANLTDLAGERCCIVGIGHVGEAVAQRASAFGMTVTGVKRDVDGYDGVAQAVFAPDALHTALSNARLVVVSVPLTELTRAMIDSEALDQLADGAILVNVARGPVVDTDALLDVLEDGPLRAAGLDVTDPEPLPPDSPLWDRADVLITPHCAGTSEKYPKRFLDRYFDQYDRWAGDGELADRVT